MPAPVQIQTPRVGIDLDRDTVPGAGFQNRVDVHFVTRTSQ
jgi:hypothetical protein